MGSLPPTHVEISDQNLKELGFIFFNSFLNVLQTLTLHPINTKAVKVLKKYFNRHTFAFDKGKNDDDLEKMQSREKTTKFACAQGMNFFDRNNSEGQRVNLVMREKCYA